MMSGKKQDVQFNSNGFTNGETPWWKTPRARMAGMGIGIAATIGFLLWFFFFHPYVSTDDARVDADIIRVANQGASQRIVEVHVTEGDRVRKGDLMVELDHRVAEAQLDRARARARLTEMDLRRAEALASQSGLSKQQLDRIRADAQTAA